MDREARLQAVRSSLKNGRAALAAVRDVGPPCVSCRYYSASKMTRKAELGRCSHPALIEHRYDRAAGKLHVNHPTWVRDARSDDGLCGPEALLYEQPAAFTRFIKALLG